MKKQKSVICTVCGAVLTEETKHEFDGKVMCENCLAGSTNLRATVTAIKPPPQQVMQWVKYPTCIFFLPITPCHRHTLREI